MALGTIATIAGIAAAAISIASVGYSVAQGAPKVPNAASSSREVAEAQANALPTQRALAAAEQQGGQAQYDVAAHREKQPFIKLPTPPSEGRGGVRQPAKYVPYVESEWQPGGKYYEQYPNFDAQSHLVQRKVKVPGGTKTADFTGYGTADVEGKLAQQYADIQTELGKKYGTQFAEEARKEAQLADPQGFAARDKELELIQNEIANPKPINPMASTLDQRIKDRLSAGSGLDDMSRELLDAAVARSAADRGGGASAQGVETSATTGQEGAARRQAATTAGQAWLTSGATPEDVEYRREQQNLADLGAFVGGKTPQSQFGALSGAGRGATPFVSGQPLPTQPNNASTVGPAYSLAAYQQNLRNQGSQANWMSGLAAALGGLGGTAAKQLGG